MSHFTTGRSKSSYFYQILNSWPIQARADKETCTLLFQDAIRYFLVDGCDDSFPLVFQPERQTKKGGLNIPGKEDIHHNPKSSSLPHQRKLGLFFIRGAVSPRTHTHYTTHSILLTMRKSVALLQCMNKCVCVCVTACLSSCPCPKSERGGACEHDRLTVCVLCAIPVAIPGQQP